MIGPSQRRRWRNSGARLPSRASSAPAPAVARRKWARACARWVNSTAFTPGSSNRIAPSNTSMGGASSLGPRYTNRRPSWPLRSMTAAAVSLVRRAACSWSSSRRMPTAPVHSSAARAVSTGQPSASSNASSLGASPARSTKWDRPSARSVKVRTTRVWGEVMGEIYVSQRAHVYFPHSHPGTPYAGGVDVLQLADRHVDGSGMRGRTPGRRVPPPRHDDQVGGTAQGGGARAAYRPRRLPDHHQVAGRVLHRILPPVSLSRVSQALVRPLPGPGRRLQDPAENSTRRNPLV